jgi:hypothetical protein
VEVTYLTSPANLVVPTTILVSEPVASAEDAGWGEMAMNMLLFNFEASQNVENNVLGLSWLLAVASYPNVTLSDVMVKTFNPTYFLVIEADFPFRTPTFKRESSSPERSVFTSSWLASIKLVIVIRSSVSYRLAQTAQFHKMVPITPTYQFKALWPSRRMGGNKTRPFHRSS